MAPRWLDAEHVLMGSVTYDCPPTPSTACGSPWGEAGKSSIIEVSSGVSSASVVASTVVARGWAGRSASTLALAGATLPPVAGSGLTIESQIGFAGVGPLAIGTPRAAIESQTGARSIPQTCDIALFPSLESGLSPSDIYYYTNRDGQISGIIILNPLIRTISGIHVGSTEADVMRTYGNVQRNEYGSQTSALVITNPEGRRVYFWMSKGVVSNILVAESAQSVVDQGQC